MKNQSIWLLVVIEILFLALLVGFFLGRNTGDNPIQVSTKPKITETVPPAPSSTAMEPININTASVEELTKLPGIGEVLAGRIIKYRQTHGPFQSLSELTLVEGIGLEKLNALKDYATIGGQP